MNSVSRYFNKQLLSKSHCTTELSSKGAAVCSTTEGGKFTCPRKKTCVSLLMLAVRPGTNIQHSEFQFPPPYSLGITVEIEKIYNKFPRCESTIYTNTGYQGKTKANMSSDVQSVKNCILSINLFHGLSLATFAFLSIVMVLETKKALNILGASNVSWPFYLRTKCVRPRQAYRHFI